ncbi:hypothetical protein TNIN_278321 [Trichonephila inaurata madagascariensis]|uniref:Uncharacterized protein n=1 Tax=Trichonephila inaurata madagascariensis TaxID=2747483 RepID=A0A8X7CMK8_9ARAC|nr:hypothetical protein TNIN_278321 [Trichonephila inaurata madagascariensis]
MSTKQTSLEIFLRKKKRLSEETEMSSTSKKRVTFNRQYHQSYLKYGFVGTGICTDGAAAMTGDCLELLGVKEVAPR